MNTSDTGVFRPSAVTLGTAQLGQPYGLSGQMPDATRARRILDGARAQGISVIDTARGYGGAEARIGAWSARQDTAPRIITKCPDLAGTADEAVDAAVRAAWEASAAALRRSLFDGYLAHGAADIRRPSVQDALRRLHGDGRIAAFGASVYTAEEAMAALGVAGLGLLQVPFSIVNTVAETAGVLARAQDLGVSVFARSVYLQGALLRRPEALPPHLAPLAPLVQRLRALAADGDRSVPELLVRAALDRPGIASVVIGFDDPAEIAGAVAAAAAPPLEQPLTRSLFALAAGLPEAVTDPRRWPKLAVPPAAPRHAG